MKHGRQIVRNAKVRGAVDPSAEVIIRSRDGSVVAKIDRDTAVWGR
jgi:hypothetical protein